MFSIPWYEKAVGNYFFGIALSFADRRFSENADKHSERRIERKLEQITALQFMVQAEQREDKDTVKTSPDYFRALEQAKYYFRQKGEKITDTKEEIEKKNLIQRIKEGVSDIIENIDYYKNNERLNSLKFGKALTPAYLIEFTADIGVAAAQIVWGIGNGFYAVGNSILYEGPALWLGIESGKGLLWIKDKFRSKKEKELDKMAEELTLDGKLLEIVRSYAPTKNIEVEHAPKAIAPKKVLELEDNAEVIDVPAAEEAQSESKVEKVIGVLEKGVYGTYDNVRSAIKKRTDERAAKEKKRKKSLLDKYDKY